MNWKIICSIDSAWSSQRRLWRYYFHFSPAETCHKYFIELSQNSTLKTTCQPSAQHYLFALCYCKRRRKCPWNIYCQQWFMERLLFQSRLWPAIITMLMTPAISRQNTTIDTTITGRIEATAIPIVLNIGGDTITMVSSLMAMMDVHKQIPRYWPRNEGILIPVNYVLFTRTYLDPFV